MHAREKAQIPDRQALDGRAIEEAREVVPGTRSELDLPGNIDCRSSRRSQRMGNLIGPNGQIQLFSLSAQDAQRQRNFASGENMLFLAPTYDSLDREGRSCHRISGKKREEKSGGKHEPLLLRPRRFRE